MKSTKALKKKQGMRKYLTLVSVGFLAIAAVLMVIFFLGSSSDLFSIAIGFMILGIAVLGLSFNIARFHDQSAAVRILAKISLVADIITAISALMLIVDVPSWFYDNCPPNCGDRTCYREYECIKRADDFISIFCVIMIITIILAIAGEIIGRYLTYKPAKKFTNVTRWTAIALTALLSIATTIYAFVGTTVPESPVAQIALCAFTLWALAVVGTPILLLAEKKKKHAK